MACFMQNICHYNCGRRFDTLHDLIIHIEATHIDFDPNVMDEVENTKLQCIPFSYILKYSSDEEIAAARADDAHKHELKPSMTYATYDEDGHLEVSRFKDVTPPPAKVKGASKAHWYGPEMNPPPAIMGNKRDCFNQQRLLKSFKNKKYMCPVSGCTKSYKNQNGMKYHIMNFHDLNGNLIKPKKDYKCNYCEKEYKTFRGLQTHILSHNERLANAKSHSHQQHHSGQHEPAVTEQQYYTHAHHSGHQIKLKHGYVMSSTGVITSHGQHGQLLKQSFVNKKLYVASSSPSSATVSNSYVLDEYTTNLERNSYMEIESGPHIVLQHAPSGSGSNVLHKKYDHLPPATPSYDDYYSIATTSAAASSSSAQGRNWSAYETSMDYSVDVDGQYTTTGSTGSNNNGTVHMSKKLVAYCPGNGETVVNEDVSEDVGYARTYIDQIQQQQQQQYEMLHSNQQLHAHQQHHLQHAQQQQIQHQQQQQHNVGNPFGSVGSSSSVSSIGSNVGGNPEAIHGFQGHASNIGTESSNDLGAERGSGERVITVFNQIG